MRFDPDQPEISDLIVSFDPETQARRPVSRSAAIQTCLTASNPHAARIIAALPESNGCLDPQVVDALLIRVHCEIQRISEEFQHGQRVQELLAPILAALRKTKETPVLHIVDIGCGTGYVIRWLASQGGFGKEVRLIGVDYHAALIQEAKRLADCEGLDCEFYAANAFHLPFAADVYLSTGVLHHFRGAALQDFFQQHDLPATQGFLHFDFQPSPLAAIGSWLFHAARMREPLARHDGVLSARRVHSGPSLLRAARQGAPQFACSLYSTRLNPLPIPRAFHTLIGLRPELCGLFEAELGKRHRRLHSWVS